MPANRSPAASRIQPIFSSVAAIVIERGSERTDSPDAAMSVRGARLIDVRLASGERQHPLAAATDEQRGVRALDRLRLAVRGS